MGIPYSRQINAAFEQVSPLVAEGFEVLRSTKDISLLLAEIQVLTVLVLCLILLVLLALTITVNPDMEIERKALVTPILKYLTSFAMTRSGQGQLGVVAFFLTTFIAGVVYAHWYWYFRRPDGDDADESEADETREPLAQQGRSNTEIEANQRGKAK